MTKVNNGEATQCFVVLSLLAVNAWLLLVALPLFWVVRQEVVSAAVWLAAGTSVVAAVGSFRWRSRAGAGATLWRCLIFPLTLLAPGFLLRADEQWPWSSTAAQALCAIILIFYLVATVLCNARRTPRRAFATEPLTRSGEGSPKDLLPPWPWWFGLTAAVVITVAAWWHTDWGSSSSTLADRARLATLTLGSLALSQYVLWGVVAPPSGPVLGPWPDPDHSLPCSGWPEPASPSDFG